MAGASVDLDGGEEVEAREDLRTEDAREGQILAHGRHLARLVAHEDVVQRFDVETVLGRGLHHHAVELREAVHVRGVVAADVAREGAQHVGGRDAVAFAAGVVDHRTDDQHQGEERQHVQTEARGVEKGERAYERFETAVERAFRRIEVRRTPVTATLVVKQEYNKVSIPCGVTLRGGVSLPVGQQFAGELFRRLGQ